ncbi:MAG: peptidoglycan D,D-transpeptidase FtsI family protein [Leadbetterella sp.]
MSTPRLNNKEEIKNRSRIMVLIFGVIAFMVLAKIAYLQNFKKKDLENEVANIQRQEKVIPATRGNIYAADGLSLLATSVPKYKVIMDPCHPKDELFNKSVDTLSHLLSKFFKDKSPEKYKLAFLNARKNKVKYLVIGHRKIDHAEKTVIAKYPLFKERFKGGAYFEKEEHRFLPLQNLAMRSVGKMKRDDPRKGEFGIEASFENFLHGKDGKGFYERLAGGYDKPVDLASDLNAETGLDVITTLDINFQDITESALRKQVVDMHAKYGSAVVMEIATGHVKAITNLTRTVGSNGLVNYAEDLNYAVKEGTDPGSTFKLVTMAALLEHGDFKPDEIVVDCRGAIIHGGRRFTCAHDHGEINMRQVFEKSCNLGIYAMMQKTFGFENPDEYYEYLQKFKITEPTGFQLMGEPSPFIKTSKSKSYSATTMPWTSIGYETRITPLQMLTFYNAVVNNGNWVQPIIVKEIKKGSMPVKTFQANIVEDIFSKNSTWKYLQSMMKGVVENGTAKNIKAGNCKVAGKTGTAQKRVNGDYTKGKYYTSFIGFFPADKPRYSCLVVINEPIGENLYANDVAAPVFKNIAEKVFSYDISLHPRYTVKSMPRKSSSGIRTGKTEDQKIIADKIGIKHKVSDAPYYKLDSDSNTNRINLVARNPNVDLHHIVGLPLKDALPILENKKFAVQYAGVGRVKEMRILSANQVFLTLE